MRRQSVFITVVALWFLAGCQVEILPTPLPTPSPFPIRPTRTPVPVTFTPAPTQLSPTATPGPDTTPLPNLPTAIQPGPYPYPGAAGTPVDTGPGGTPAAPGDARVTPRPSVSVSPEQGSIGTVFTATGRNWLPGEGIFLIMAPEGSDMTGQVGIAVAGDDGRFGATFTLPGNWPSDRQINLIAENYNRSRQATTSIAFLSSTPTQVITAWRGEYFTNPDLAGSPAVTRNDERVNFEWEDRPDINLPADYFSARWTRQIDFEQGLYRFDLTGDDGVRLFIDNESVIDEWHVNSGATFSVQRYLVAGPHLIRVELYDGGGRAMVRLAWAQQRDQAGWRARYYPNRNLTGAAALVQNEPELTYRWGGAPPAPSISGENWSARWTQTIDLPAGTYRFYLSADDGVRLRVDGDRLIDEWHEAEVGTYFADVELGDGEHDIQVDYYQGVGDSYLDLWWDVIDPNKFPDWRGEYFPNKTLSGRPVLIRNDSAIDFDWQNGSPDPAVPADGFSVRWTRHVDIPEDESGNYRFTLQADDGARLWLDDDLVMDRWTATPGSTEEKFLYLTEGTHDLRLEYTEDGGLAQVRLSWERQSLP
jgi:hypothetical protein